ncbi:MAG: AraC family transcriptional regulator [Rudaea sp.]
MASEAAPDRSLVDRTFEINLTPVERLLRKTPLIGVGEYRCPVDDPQFKFGGPEKCPFIVFSRASVYLTPSRGVGQVCTPNVVNLLDVGDSYERRPVDHEGAVCDWIALAPSLLREIAAEIDPVRGHEHEHIFPRAMAPISSDIYLEQRSFFLNVIRNPDLPTLAIEEAAIGLATRVVSESMNIAGPEHAAMKLDRRSAQRVRERIEEAKAIMAREFSEKLSITDIARRVYWSPGYLARQFLLETGSTLHQYQQRLRLRAALAYLSESRFDGAATALQLGFASHSHFSAAFAKEYGITPTAFMRTLPTSAAQKFQFLPLR